MSILKSSYLSLSTIGWYARNDNIAPPRLSLPPIHIYSQRLLNAAVLKSRVITMHINRKSKKRNTCDKYVFKRQTVEVLQIIRMSPTKILCNMHYASILNFLALLYFISTDVLNFSTACVKSNAYK